MAAPTAERTLIVVLAYNEASSIAATVAEIAREAPWADVLVVDDGSHDETSAKALACGVLVARHPINLGVAAAEATGLKYAVRNGYRAMLRMDGDGQHDPRSAKALLQALAGADLAVGSRYLERTGFQSSAMRRFGNDVLCRILFLLSRRRFTDPTSGFRAFGQRAIEYFARHFPHDYPEPESLLWAARMEFRVAEVPVQMRARQAGKSSLTPLRSAYYMSKVCLALGLELLRPKEVMTRSSDIVLTLALVFAGYVLSAARRLRLNERTVLGWLGISAVVAGLAIWRPGIDRLAAWMGIYYAPSALFALMSGSLLVLLFRQSVKLALLETQLARVAQEVALAGVQRGAPVEGVAPLPSTSPKAS